MGGGWVHDSGGFSRVNATTLEPLRAAQVENRRERKRGRSSRTPRTRRRETRHLPARCTSRGRAFGIRRKLHPMHARNESGMWSRSTECGSPPALSVHTRTVPSQDALARRSPSGDHATCLTDRRRPGPIPVSWPRRTRGAPLPGVHTRTVPSQDALARRSPSSDHATCQPRLRGPAGRGGRRRRGSTPARCHRWTRWRGGPRRAPTPRARPPRARAGRGGRRRRGSTPARCRLWTRWRGGPRRRPRHVW